ncbi:srg family chemoreceptor domain-containing protein [Ditylenchus destructor]|uniref:Serpentine receptor class gamma n=1 Tax=Ditylenchus destructor TaxID=166010 RepID=A0AAD4MWI3_9BILA|nr:srg family chemoreceptor domain-containing protein [Ditylenchus destructor]
MAFGAVLASSPLTPFIIGLVIGVPSVILYLLEAIILIKYWKQLHSPFFRLFLVRFTLNFLNYICSYMYARLGRVGLFYEFFQSSPSLVLAIWFTFYYYSFHAENLATMFILINRLTSIVFAIIHVKIWKYLLPLSILIIAIVPIPFTAPMLTYKFNARLQTDNYSYSIYHIPLTEGDFQLEPSFISAISAVIFCIICGALNILTLIVYNSNSNGNNLADQIQQKIEKRLTIYAIITFMGHLYMAVYMIAIYVFCCMMDMDSLFLATFNQLPWVSDFSTIVVPAWVLLWASNKIRALMIKELRLEKWPLVGKLVVNIQKQTTITVISNSRSDFD